MRKAIVMLCGLGLLAVTSDTTFAATGISNITGPGSGEKCANAIAAANTALSQARAAGHPNAESHASKVLVRVAYNDMRYAVKASDIANVKTHRAGQIAKLIFAPALAATWRAAVAGAPSPSAGGGVAGAVGEAAKATQNPALGN